MTSGEKMEDAPTRADPRLHRRHRKTNPVTAMIRSRSVLDMLGVSAAVAVAVASRWSTLSQPLLEAHSFRQTQTALTSVQFFQRGVWTRPLLPVLGSPWQVPFEFPLFQASAATIMGLGGGADFSNRLACLMWFCITAALVFWLARTYASAGAAWASLLVFTFSPFAVQWSRTAMIEYCATAMALLWIGGLFKWRTSRKWWWATIAVSAGILAFLVKPTTAVPLMIPAVLFTPLGSTKRRQDPTLFALLLVPVAAGVAWTLWADHVKSNSVFTAWLTSGALRDWNIGTIQQRLEPANLMGILGRIDQTLAGVLGLMAIACALLLSRRNHVLWVGFALSVPAGIAIFYNLYVVHDYYLAALSPAIALSIGVGAAAAAQSLQLSRALNRAALVGAIAVWLAWMSWYGQDYRALSELPVQPGPESAEVREHSSPEEQVLIAGEDWSSVIPYYSNRKALMLRTPGFPGAAGPYDSYEDAREVVGELKDLSKYALLFASNPDSEEIEFAAVRPWFGAVGPRTVRLGENPDDVAMASVVGTTDTAWLDATLASTPSGLRSGSVDLLCDGVAGFELAASGTPRAFRTFSTGSARLLVGDGLALLPVRSGVFVRGGPQPSSLRCLGGGSIRFQG